MNGIRTGSMGDVGGGEHGMEWGKEREKRNNVIIF